jgi:uncharacterized protein YjbI with pentapeptide repeats
LFTAVVAAVVMGGGLAVLWFALIRTVVGSDAARIDVLKVALTAVAGVGGAVALVVAYRRQNDLEQGRFVERFGAAAAQLGDPDPAVRIAGVYAMAGVGDESTGLRRQQCIEVLCGYLRLPYSPELGSNHQSKLVLTEERTGADGSPRVQQERHLEYRQNDKEVRATILRVIADHLRDHEYRWSACDFDFRTAHLEDVDFDHAVFGGTTRFEMATFSGDTWFYGATFSGPAKFVGATFSGTAEFGGATFSRPAKFDGATFSGYAGFVGMTFSGGAAFYGARFSRDAVFVGAKFSDAGFGDAVFCGDAGFGGATFYGDAGFVSATFSGDAVFAGDAAAFYGPTFSEDIGLEGAKFSGPARFVGVTFSGHARFYGVTFSGDAAFYGATFSGPTSFTGTDFGSGAIAFENPRQWGPPAPAFDWDGDPSTKPENVTPHRWPPTPPVA